MGTILSLAMELRPASSAGVTACPAKHAVTHRDERFAVGAFGRDGGVQTVNSGSGTLLGGVGTYDLRPVDGTGDEEDGKWH